MLRDPATGYAKRKPFVSPWICVPSTDNDLDDPFEIWKALVENIHSMIESDDFEAEPEYGLANEHILSLMPDCCAKSFFSRALKPRFKYIAPGLRIQGIEELLDQPFASSFAQAEGEERSIPPILVFRGHGTAAPSEPFRDFSKGEIPIRLYLAPSDEIDPSPWEDGATLILPSDVGGDDTWARLADERPFPVRNDSLY